MLRLTLIRHAKTEPAHPGQEDWDRVLEASGQRDATEMGRRMKQRKLKPDRLLTSPAVRTLATTQLLARELGIPRSKQFQDERLYLASAKDMLKVIHALGGDARHLGVVGHNPGITDFADQVSNERSMENMPTGAVYTLEFDMANWSELGWGSGMNAEFDYPKKA